MQASHDKSVLLCRSSCTLTMPTHSVSMFTSSTSSCWRKDLYEVAAELGGLSIYKFLSEVWWRSKLLLFIFFYSSDVCLVFTYNIDVMHVTFHAEVFSSFLAIYTKSAFQTDEMFEICFKGLNFCFVILKNTISFVAVSLLHTSNIATT